MHPPAKETKETPCQGDPPPPRRPPQGPHPGGKLRGIRSRPTAKGEIEGDQIQAHTQGKIEGNQIQAHTQGGNSRPTPKGEIRGGSGPDPLPPPRRLLLRAVRILLECILVEVICGFAVILSDT